jgi:hypothetical protein
VNENPIEAQLYCNGTGWCVEWYQEDLGTPLGYRVSYWFGSREECMKRMLSGPEPLEPAVSSTERSYIYQAIE